ncbi:MAG TPA: PEP/pyruvate-binding domain-containing protein, partial [Candidatus Paceibacterota bacterium]|nr:PEP/pyruvate-binding domain-containing protein [Candidatus Paceibacterota bacterium]
MKNRDPIYSRSAIVAAPRPDLLTMEDRGDRVTDIESRAPCVGGKWRLVTALALAILSAWPASHAANLLSEIRPETNGWVRVAGHMATNQTVQLEWSPDLRRWEDLALLDFRQPKPDAYNEWWATNDTFAFLDLAAPTQPRRFYRFHTAPFEATNDWKNQVLSTDDAFAQSGLNSDLDAIRWVKFAVLFDDPYRVVYQDGRVYLLHHQFATNRLAPFRGLSADEFDRVSLFASNQQVLLGTVLFPPRPGIREYGIQFAGRDPYPRELVRTFFERVVSTVVAPADVTPFYLPAFEQSETALIDEAYFEAHGIRVSSVNRWVTSDQVYAAGWALGRLRVLPAAQIDAAYADGRLSPQDILVTDGVPAEVPFLSGILSTTPATPNSHVAILAQAYGIPFAFVAGAAAQARLAQLDGREVVLQATLRSGFAQVSVLEAEEALTPALREELLGLKRPPTPRIQPVSAYGAFIAPVDALRPDDIRYFGGKAAHFGLLRRSIPADSPEAIAFSFDLWTAFMSQVLPSGRRLADEIQMRLAAHTNYPPDIARVRQDLEAVRDLVTRTARFTPEQQTAITNALSHFDPLRRIRFRSSSNAEDGETFSAAGLYDSYSGCLADDLDDDTRGPCRCDPTEGNERGVFRAIQKVYACFYNDNAFLERLRHGLDERAVGMAVLVHYSTPDEYELANGVATVSIEAQLWGGARLKARLVTQKGAVSVTNPAGSALPEVVEVFDPDQIELLQPSGLVPLGSQVLDWPKEYETLAGLLFRVYTDYVDEAGGGAPTNLVLDFEYKKVEPGKLLVKQVRPVPQPPPLSSTRYLLGEAVTYGVYPREGSDILANHRLKCRLDLRTFGGRLTDTNLAEALYAHARLEFRQGSALHTIEGMPSEWPDATHAVSQDPRRGTIVEDGWTFGTGSNRWTFLLTSVIPSAASEATPFLAQAEIRKWLRVTYATPQPIFGTAGAPRTTATEEVQLVTLPGAATLSPDPPEAFEGPGNLHFQVRFLNPTNQSGPPLGVDQNFWGTYPASYSTWLESEIEGATLEPLALRDYYAQSAMPTTGTCVSAWRTGRSSR